MPDEDFSRLVRDLGEVPRNSGENIRKAVEVTARKVKDAWSEKLDGAYGLPGLSRSVDYEMGATAGSDYGTVDAEIGINKGRFQGPLGNVSEFGTPSTPARGYGHAALQENEEDFDRGIEKAIDDALKAVDL